MQSESEQQQSNSASVGPTTVSRSVLVNGKDKFVSVAEEWGVAFPLNAKTIVAALGVHELLGMGIAVGAFFVCLRVRPVSRLSKILSARSPRAGRWVKKRESAVTQAMRRFSTSKWLPRVAKRITLERQLHFATAFVEGVALRKVMTPVLVPAKLVTAAWVCSRVFSGEHTESVE